MQLGAELGEALTSFLKENLDVSTCDHSYMIEIYPNIMCYHPNIHPNKKKGWRPINGERATAQQEEVDRLLKASPVKEAFHPT